MSSTQNNPSRWSFHSLSTLNIINCHQILSSALNKSPQKLHFQPNNKIPFQGLENENRFPEAVNPFRQQSQSCWPTKGEINWTLRRCLRPPSPRRCFHFPGKLSLHHQTQQRNQSKARERLGGGRLFLLLIFTENITLSVALRRRRQANIRKAFSWRD